VIRRLWDLLAPLRPPGQDRGYRRLLRWAALPVTNRRWAAPLCALALGFGLFAGVAIGPGASGSLATGAPQIVEIPGLLGDDGNGAEEPEEEEEAAGEVTESGGEETESFAGESSSSEFLPSYTEPEAEEVPEEETFPEGRKEEEDAATEPEEGEAQVLSGVVVHANAAAGSYTIAETGGLLSAIHASKLPTPGTKVKVPVRILANGTYAEDGARQKTGATNGASFTGIVTFVDSDPAAPAYAVSKRGVSLLVRVHPDPTGATPQLPALGAYASVKAEIETPLPPATPPPPGEAPAAAAPSCAPDPATPPSPKPVAVLWQRTLAADGAPFASSDLEGVVMAVCPDQGQLLLSGDDMREAGADVVLTVPSEIDTSKLVPGDSVAATAAIEAGGALKLTGLASDERTKGADDVAATQGELVPSTPQ